MTRPSWDVYFLKIAVAVSARADCSRRQVGAVIVKANRIVATGYNGAPAGQTGCLEGACPRDKHYKAYDKRHGDPICHCGNDWPCSDEVATGSQYDYGAGACIAVHAEANALLYADRDKCEGATIYCTEVPCSWCYKLIEGAGIARVKTPGLEFNLG